MPSGNQKKVITITFPTDSYFTSGIRDFTFTMVKNLTGLSDQWAYRFQSVVDELCSNAIEHGSAPGDTVAITFTAEAGQTLQVIVEDNGTGTQKNTAEDIMAKIKRVEDGGNVQDIGLRGRGLAQIVKTWSDQLILENRPGGGIKVTAIKNLANIEKNHKEEFHPQFIPEGV